MDNRRIVTRHQHYHRILVCFCVMLLAFLPAHAFAQELAPPQMVVEATSQRLIDLMERDKERILTDAAYVYDIANEVLVPHVDMARVARLVLGKHWRRATKQQRHDFSDAFRILLIRTYATAMREFRGDADIRFLPMRHKDGEKNVVVNTMMSQAGSQPVAVDYRMHLTHGKWLTYDVKIEGVSLVTNYRSNFARQIREGGIDNLIARIQELNEKKLKQAAQALADNK